MPANEDFAQAKHVALVARSIEALDDRRSMLEYARRLRERAMGDASHIQQRPDEARSWKR